MPLEGALIIQTNGQSAAKSISLHNDKVFILTEQ